jgi:radical SAM superfamily enzyme YgiQ (UPF0313 family)
MDIVLINPNPGGTGLNDATISPPLGLAYIASLLEQNNFKCKIIDANLLDLSNDEIFELIPNKTRLIGFYLNSFSYSAVQNLTKQIRTTRRNSLILMGGPLPSAADPSDLLKEIECDGLIRGEGEYSVLKIMENIRDNKFHFEGDISGLCYFKSDNEMISNPVQRILDLDKLPFPAFHLLPPFKTYKTRARKSPVGSIITSRGCTFDCTFCSKDIFQRRVTYRSAENVLDEIDYLVKKYGVRQIDIMDDNFAMKKSRFIDILDGIIERNYGIALNFQLGIRTEILNEELFRKMKKAGVYKLGFGIESVDENVLELHKKRLDVKKLEEAVKMAKEMKFVVYGFFIVGLVGETEEGFEKTLAFAKKLNLDVANFCMAIPFVNTELYRMVKERGHFLINTSRNIDVGFYGGEVFYEYDNYKKEDILNRYQKAYNEFYSFGKKLKVLLTVRSLSELHWLINAMFFVLKSKAKIVFAAKS